MNVSGLGALVWVVLAATARTGGGPDGSGRDGTARQIADRARKSLEASGFQATVEDDLDVERDRGRVRLVVSRALDSEVRSVSLLRLSMSDDCADCSDADEAFAHRAGVTDLATAAG